MNEELTTADPVAWRAALLNFKAAQVDFRSLKDADDVPAAAATCLRYSDAERALLALAAPDINAVIEKLFVLFDSELWEETEDACHKQRVIGDLRRIEILQD
jgi:hypothetical protein